MMDMKIMLLLRRSQHLSPGIAVDLGAPLERIEACSCRSSSNLDMGSSNNERYDSVEIGVD